MLSQRRGRRSNPRCTLTVLDRGAHQLHWATGGMVNLTDHAARPDMLMIQRILDIVDGGIRHAGALEDVEPLLCGFSPCDFLNHVLELDTVEDAAVVGDEAVVRLPLGPAQLVADDAEEAIVAAAKHDVAIQGLEPLVRHDARVRSAPPPAVALPADQHAAGNVRQRRHLAIRQRHVHVLPCPRLLSRQKTRHDRVACVQSRRQVRHRHPDLYG